MTSSTTPAVQPLSALRGSARLLRRHPVAILALGASLVVSSAAVCCGLGLLATPWFGCELCATQLGAGTGQRPARRSSWFGAAVFYLGALLMVISAGWFSMLGLGVDMPVTDTTVVGSDADLPGIGFALVGVFTGLMFLLPFTYAPIVLIDRGGSLGAASMESARLVADGGVLRHVGLSITSHVIQASPVLVVGSIAFAVAGPSMLPVAALAATPLLALTVPLGQGMLVAAYIDRRDGVRVEPSGATKVARPLVFGIALLAAAPGLSLGLLASTLVTPSRPRAEPAPSGELVADAVLEDGAAHEIVVPGTALAVLAGPDGVSVEASDGGGAGALPLRGRPPVLGVRVVRVRDAHAVEIRTRDGEETAWIDRAGVRLDDTLGERLTDRVPTWGFFAVGAALLLTPLALGTAFVALSRRRRGETSSLMRAWVFMALAVPVVLAALAAGLLAVFGRG